MFRVFFLLFLIPILPTNGYAASCKDGSPLYTLLNQSEAVAVVDKAARVRFVYNRGGRGAKIQSSVREFIKSPIVSEFDERVPQTVYFEGMDPARSWGRRRYLVFLNYVAPNTWYVKRCQYLEIGGNEMVENACSAISDLFGENPYQRERKCLLRYPPSASLSAVRTEISKKLSISREVVETGKFARNGRWVPGTDYQLIVFELPVRARKDFFASKRLIASFPIKAYIKTENLSQKKFENHVRKGVRFSFRGTWREGNFVVNSIDWLSGRRPR